MHVIYIHQHFSTRKGATGTRSYEMSRRLLAAGHRVTMICGAYGHGDLKADAATRMTEHDIDAADCRLAWNESGASPERAVRL